MRTLPSRFRRLDDALADLPVDGDGAMLLSELDGFLTGLAICPDEIATGEWLPLVWREPDGGAPFADPIDARMFADMVVARREEIRRELGRGKPQPLFDAEARTGAPLWEPWIEGLDTALTLRPDIWAALEGGDDREAAEAYATLTMLITIAFDETALTSVEINALCDDAPAMIVDRLATLYAWRVRHETRNDPAAGAKPAKIGRNAPCPCGSGRKSKQCCGAG